jgi:hypothetical protein
MAEDKRAAETSISEKKTEKNKNKMWQKTRGQRGLSRAYNQANWVRTNSETSALT